MASKKKKKPAKKVKSKGTKTKKVKAKKSAAKSARKAAKKTAKKAAKKVASKKSAKKSSSKSKKTKTAAKKSAKKVASKRTTKPARASSAKKAAAASAAAVVASTVAAAAAQETSAATPEAEPAPAEEERGGLPSLGTLAPEFHLLSQSGEEISLADYRGRANVVLYFYPKDDTPGCTVEACNFRDDHRLFAGSNTVVLGVSPDDVTSHEKFAGKYSLPFPLLADTNADVAKAYGVWVEKNMYGNKKMGIQRSTFLIDRNGAIAAVWPKVKVEGHSQEVLEKIKGL